MAGCVFVPLQFTLHLSYFLDEISEKKPHAITISFWNDKPTHNNFSHRLYTNFDRDKLFLEKSSIILLITNQKWVELMNKVSYAQGEKRISEIIREREI